jgi:ADP-ribosylglycohydrolase
LAVAKWLMDDPTHESDSLVRIMQDMGRRYPSAGYGGMFRKWLNSDNPRPYGSFANGSAMRVSPVGMYAKSLDEALELARITASVTHNHPEGIKGAQAIAAAVYMQLNENFDTNGKIKRFVEEKFGYNLDVKLEDIRDDYHFDVTCQGSVPIAIMAFLQRYNALDSLRLAISMGGDSDTIGCMTTSIAYACPFYIISSHTNIPEEVISKCRELLPKELLELNDRFEAYVTRPLYQSYYLGTRNIFAGEYPGDKNGEKAQGKIDQMVHFGVRHFIDLTEEGELRPYSHLLPKDCTYTRFPIRDVNVPDSVESVARLIGHIQELSKRDDGYVYIHCWGGVGRTGTIVGCYLAEDLKKSSYKYSQSIKNDELTESVMR